MITECSFRGDLPWRRPSPDIDTFRLAHARELRRLLGSRASELRILAQRLRELGERRLRERRKRLRRDLLGPDAGRPRPALEDLVAGWEHSRESVRTGLRLFGEAADASGESLVLDRAEIDAQGWVSASYYATDRLRHVRPGDVIHQGVAFQGSLQSGAFDIRPRLWRAVCANGAMVELPARRTEHIQDSPGVGGVSEQVLRALDDRELLTTTLRWTVAARTPVSHASSTLERGGMRLSRGHRETVHFNFHRNGDRTLYGAWNALTQTARDQSSIEQRVVLEKAAGFLMRLPLSRFSAAAERSRAHALAPSSAFSQSE